MSKKQYYFKKEDAEICYTMDRILSEMKADGVDELTVFEAYPYKENGIFWCKHDAFCGEKNEGICGKECRNYTPRNGKSGCCKYYTNTLYYPGDEILITLNK